MTYGPATLAAIARAKEEILADMERGVVPSTVDDFGELHDFVDANEYGGLCEDGHGLDEQAVEDVQDEVHRWLADGRPDSRPVRTNRRLLSLIVREDDLATILASAGEAIRKRIPEDAEGKRALERVQHEAKVSRESVR